jgi:hypothetical protein
LKILVDGCYNRLKCGGCVVKWGSLEGVVSSCEARVVSVDVGLERLKGLMVRGWGCCVFLYLAWVGRVRA